MNLLITNVRIADGKETGMMRVPTAEMIRMTAMDMYPSWKTASERDLISLYVQSTLVMSYGVTYTIAGETTLPTVKSLNEYNWDCEVFELKGNSSWVYYEVSVDPDYVIYVSDEYNRSEITLHDAVLNDLLHRLNFTTNIYKRL